jgi:hypothetical protein
VSTSGYCDRVARTATGPTERHMAEADLVALMRLRRLGDPQVARPDNPTEPFQQIALSEQPDVRALKGVSLTRPSGPSGVAICGVRLG